MSKAVAQATQIEPSFQPRESFENAGDHERREWAEHSGDWAFGVLRFLQGRRQNEISLAEVLTTQTYTRSTQREKDALRFVAAQSEQRHLVSDEDRRRLIERDSFLIKFVDGETLGHSDWVTQIQAIPAGVVRAQAVDAAMFKTTFPSPVLFRWIWGTTVMPCPRTN